MSTSSPVPSPPASPASAPEPRRHRWVPLAVAVGALALLVVSAVVAAHWIRHLSELVAPAAGPTPGRVTVARVIDGDTIEVLDPRRDASTVRLIGIDTPETKDPRSPVQCFGEEATDATTTLLPPGTEVRLEADVEQRDRYDRVLAYVYRSSDGLFVNLELARRGYADLLTYPPNVAHTAELSAAVAAARRERLGLWQACGGPDRPADAAAGASGRPEAGSGSGG
jgi:micrococcal nuclease